MMPDAGALRRSRRRRRGPSSDSDHDDMPKEVAPERPRRRRRGPSSNSDLDDMPNGGEPERHRRVTRSLSSKSDHHETPHGGAPERPRRIRRHPSGDTGHQETPNGGTPVRPRRRRRGPTHESGGQQYWADLPDPLLYSICQRLSLIEFAALAGTCKSWRSFAAATRGEFMASQAPLLCSADGSGLYDPAHNRTLRHRRLLSLVRRQNAKILDICHGYLVVKCCAGSRPKKRLLFLNLFTGDEVTDVPLLPEGSVSWVVLTARPTSPACVVVACLKRRSDFQHGAVLSCRRGDAHWSMSEWYGPGKPVVVGRRLCALEWLRSGKRLLISGPYSCPTKNSEVLEETPSLHCKHLVEVGGKLLFIEHWGKKGVAYRLGGRRQKMEKVTDLGDRAVLVSHSGFAVSDCPGGWGGNANCIYFTCGGPECRIHALQLDQDGWTVEAPFGVPADAPLKKHLGASRPRAFWVVPSLCH